MDKSYFGHGGPMLYVAVELEQKIISLIEKNKRRKSFVFLFIFGQNKTKFRIFSRKYERGQFCPDLTSWGTSDAIYGHVYNCT